MANLNENDKVEIKVDEGNLIISPVKRHRTLKERMAGYKGDYQCYEWVLKSHEVPGRFP